MRNSIGVAVAALVLAVAAASVAAAGQYPQDHDGWSIGFGFGSSSVGFTSDGMSSGRGSGTMGNVRVGYPLNERVSLAWEANVWTRSEYGYDYTCVAHTFGVAVYPSEGFVLRGGLGVGQVSVADDLLFRAGGSLPTRNETGLGLHAGAGYELRILRRLAIGPQLDFGLATMDGGQVNWLGAGINFNWYFVNAR